jgi:hypothetical protein
MKTNEQTVLSEALDRMDRARSILTDDNPRPECNWGMLDTSDLRARLPAASEAEKAAEYTRGRADGWEAAKASDAGAVPVAWMLEHNMGKAPLFCRGSNDPSDIWGEKYLPLYDRPAPVEAGAVPIYQCMTNDDDDNPTSAKLWMDMDKAEYDDISVRRDIRSRIVYDAPPAPVDAGAVDFQHIAGMLESYVSCIKEYALANDLERWHYIPEVEEQAAILRSVANRAPSDAPAQQDMRDAYVGAREDLEIWKRRALEAEELNRKFAASINGPTFMGEPAPAAQGDAHPNCPPPVNEIERAEREHMGCAFCNTGIYAQGDERALALRDLDKLVEYSNDSDDHGYGTIAADLVRELTAKARAALSRQPSAGDATPTKPGVYVWTAGTHSALVLVDRRPSDHSPGGVLNGHVIESTKFYHGCPVDRWGKDGLWILLHDFDAARAQRAAEGDSHE